MARICPNCGNELKERSDFCGKCGQKWDDDIAAVSEKPEMKRAVGFAVKHKKGLIGAAALILAAVLLLVIINPANSPKAVFNRYLSCLHSRNESVMRELSYDANYSKSLTAEEVTDTYKGRFLSAGSDYTNSGSADLLKDTKVKIQRVETPKKSSFSERRNTLANSYRNTARITDIRTITFSVTSGENTSVGTAELICVTGKWYIGEVTGI